MTDNDDVTDSGDPTQSEQSEGEQIEHDKQYGPASERETETRQRHPRRSEATDDPDIDPDDVDVLPGTGGPDDPGDVEVDPDDIHLP